MNVFGEVNAYIYSVEWQKPELPHAHILLWLKTKIQPDKIDSIISAEIPNEAEDPLLYKIVCRSIIHGQRSFIKETQTTENGYLTYRRRSPKDEGYTATLKIRNHDVLIVNRWVVPCSPLLSQSFNVEYFHSVQAIKCVIKYVLKESD